MEKGHLTRSEHDNSPRIMEWTNKLTLEFIYLYKRETCIWNPKDPKRKHRKCVLDAWARIANSMSMPCTVEELKKKKESIMAIFRSVRLKERTMLQSGEGHYFQPNWFAYKALSFLKDAYRPKPPDDTEGTFDPEEFENSISSPTPALENALCNSEKYDKQYDSQTQASTSNNVSKSPSQIVAKKRRVEVIETHTEEASNYDAMPNTRETNRKEICKMYTDLLATKLVRFNEDTRDYLMHEIDNLVYRTKIGQKNLQAQQNTTTTRTTYAPAGSTNPQQVPEETIYTHEPRMPTVESSYVQQNSPPPLFVSQEQVKEEDEYV